MASKHILHRGGQSLRSYPKKHPASSQPAGKAQDKRQTGPERYAGNDPEELVLSNLLFVAKIANEYRNRGVPFEDLLNEGNIGLIRAASRFDPGRGVKFTSYAVWWIRKAIRLAIEEQGPVIRVPEYHRRKAARLKQSHEASRLKHGHHSSGPGCIVCGPRHPARGIHTISLDDPQKHDQPGSLTDTLLDGRAVDPVGKMIRREALAGLQRALRCLTTKEREVIIGRYGLGEQEPRTLKEIGTKLGLSRERVRQIEATAKAKLRDCFARAAERPARSRAC